MNTKFMVVLMITLLTGEPMSFKIKGSYYGRRGNLDYHYYEGSFSISKFGAIQLGGFSLQDTEFLLSGSRAKSTYNKQPYENDGEALLKLDLFANQKFSPFVFAEWEFDSIYALEKRENIGLGAKYRFGKYFSVSYAALFEQEKYSNVDTTATLYRHSLRPKYKRKFENLGMFVDWQVFYKPQINDLEKYLLKSIIEFSFDTFHESLTLNVNYKYDFNSRYEIEKVVKNYEYDVDDYLGYYTVEEYEYYYGEIDFTYTTDADGYVMIPGSYYKPEDYTLSIGLTFKF